MAAHRYWGVWLSGPLQSVGIAVLSELSFRTSIGGANAAVGGTPSTSMSVSSGTLANLFDGNTATSVSLSGLNTGVAGWVRYDFLTPVEILELFMSVPSTGAPGAGNARQFAVLQYSDDGVAWTTLAPVISTLALSTNSATVTAPDFGPVAPPRLAGTARVAPGWPTGNPLRAYYLRKFNEYNSGNYYLAGTTKIDDTPDIPVSRLVRLYERVSGRAVAEQWSEFGTGNYRFDNLKLQRYFVLSHDHTLYYNAVIKDEIVPEPMP